VDAQAAANGQRQEHKVIEQADAQEEHDAAESDHGFIREVRGRDKDYQHTPHR